MLIRDSIIARTGEQLYVAGEVPVSAGKDGLIRIDRSPEAVFDADTIASFNGKPVTLDHPDDDVNPDNWRQLAVGVVHDVRRGTGISDNFLLADLMITDRTAIKAIQDGIRELSCGYSADYVESEPGRGMQTTIRGNHVALVSKGRCGASCAIGDKENTTMKWTDKIRAAFKAQDHKEFENILKLRDADGDGEGMLAEMKSTLEEIDGNVNELRDKHTEMATRMDGLETKTNDAMKKASDAIAKAKARDEAEAAAAEEEKKEKEKETKDAEEAAEEERKKKEEEDKGSAKDSGALVEEVQETFARVEILSPGIQLPTHDAAMGVAKMRDSLCALRRKALESAFSGSGRDALVPFVGTTPDFAKMTCDAAKMAVTGASEVIKARNTAGTFSSTAARDQHTQTLTAIASINQANKKFWNRN